MRSSLPGTDSPRPVVPEGIKARVLELLQGRFCFTVRCSVEIFTMTNQPISPKSHTNSADLTFRVPHGRSTRDRGSITDNIRSASALPSYITAFMPLGTIGRCFTTVLVILFFRRFPFPVSRKEHYLRVAGNGQRATGNEKRKTKNEKHPLHLAKCYADNPKVLLMDSGLFHGELRRLQKTVIG